MAGRSCGKAFPVFIVILIFVGVFAFGVFHDLRLDRTTVNEDKKDTGIRISNLGFERDISGDIWIMNSESAIKTDSSIKGYSVDISMRSKDGREWKAWSPEALYSETERSLVMKDARGEGAGKQTNMEWSAKTAIFLEDKEEWSFPDGIDIFNKSIDIHGTEAKVDIDGTIKLEDGAKAIWKIGEDP